MGFQLIYSFKVTKVSWIDCCLKEKTIVPTATHELGNSTNCHSASFACYTYFKQQDHRTAIQDQS